MRVVLQRVSRAKVTIEGRISGSIERVTQASGGEAYYPQDVSLLAGEYRRVLENLRRRYVISYTSTNSMRDGKFRAVEVRSKRAGIVIGGQKGYFAPAK